MELLVGLGAVISVIGLIGIVLSIAQVRKAKKTARDDAELKERLMLYCAPGIATRVRANEDQISGFD